MIKDHIDRVGIELHSRWKEVKLGKVNEWGNTSEHDLIDYMMNTIKNEENKKS